MKPIFNLTKAVLRLLFSSGLLLTSLGCAVERVKGGVRISTDMAEIIGVKLGEFDTPNGKAVLRHDGNGHYSIKLTNSLKVIDVGHYRNVEIFKSLSVNKEQVVILETSNNACPRAYLMYSFSPEKDAFIGKLGDCRSPMNFMVSGETLFALIGADFLNSRRFWEYRDGKLIGPKSRAFRVNRATAYETERRKIKEEQAISKRNTEEISKQDEAQSARSAEAERMKFQRGPTSAQRMLSRAAAAGAAHQVDKRGSEDEVSAKASIRAANGKPRSGGRSQHRATKQSEGTATHSATPKRVIQKRTKAVDVNVGPRKVDVPKQGVRRPAVTIKLD